LRDMIRARALCWAVACVDARIIDRVNILQATYQAMREAITQLAPCPQFVLVDGWALPGSPVRLRALIHGDRTCASIAAASILAKVARDEMMGALADRYPGYGFARHKGYATQEHLAQLALLGPCPEHRTTFAPVRDLLQQRLPLHERDHPGSLRAGRADQ